MRDPLAFNPWSVKIRPSIPPAEKILYDTEVDLTYLVDGYGNFIVFDECQDNVVIGISQGQLNQPYYFNPYSPDGIVIYSSDCPCCDTEILNDLINYNGFNLINYDGSYLIDYIQYEQNHNI